MEEVDLLILNASEILTLRNYNLSEIKRDSLSIIKNGAVAIKDGIIIDVGTTKRLSKKYKAVETMEARNKTVLPGFIDPHTHLVFAGSREFELDLKLKGYTYQEILEKHGGGIYYTVEKTREASKTELISEGKKRLDTMLAYGTTTCEAKSGYGLTTRDEIKILEVTKKLNQQHPIEIVPTFLGAHAIPKEYINRKEEYVELIIDEMLPKVAEKKLAKFCDVFCEKGFFKPEQSIKILQEAKKHGLTPKIHADEFSDNKGAKIAAELDAISADHLLKASDKNLREMARKKTIAVLLPATPFSMMLKEYANARKMIDYGIPVALATDLNPNCYTENMQFIIQLACLKMKMTPAEAIIGATINAAHAIGLANKIGSIEKGKQADIIILDCPNHMFIPYHFGINLVEHVIKKGKLVR
ncbi:MAG TPA: imidazolonepropionase [Thermoplasmatales archaeon]|nr:imidazolonepropionase [Thermoplasmatales archaeon]